VVYPPVEVEDFRISSEIGDYYLYLGSFAPYKKADLAIRACMETGRILYLVGSGQDEKRLRQLARGSRSIKFLGWLDDTTLVEYLSKAKALLFPGEEDFGIVPVEALASGRPVLAYARGGALETLMTASEREQLLDGSTGQVRFDEPSRVGGGVLFPKRDVSTIINGLDLLDGSRFEPHALREMALAFRPEVFRKGFTEEVDDVLKSSVTEHA
jgi:glycosyltransferase involved in cell wall biosynthesis